MTRLEDRQTLVAEITVARAAGARLAPACALVGIDLRTFQRWRGGDGQVQTDCRPEAVRPRRSEEHTSELQSHSDLVCRLLLEKKKKIKITKFITKKKKKKNK